METQQTKVAIATSLHDLVPEHLKCSICLELFADPHFAGCGVHAFCKGCLDSLAAASVGAGATGATGATGAGAVRAANDDARRVGGPRETSDVLYISCPHCRRGRRIRK